MCKNTDIKNKLNKPEKQLIKTYQGLEQGVACHQMSSIYIGNILRNWDKNVKTRNINIPTNANKNLIICR